MFQKRHMECVAYRMQRIQPDPNQPERMDQWWITVAELGDMFSVSNPNFDRDRFERACQRGADVSERPRKQSYPHANTARRSVFRQGD